MPVTHQLVNDLNIIKWGLAFATNTGISFDFFLKRRDVPDFVWYTDAAGVHGGIGGYSHMPNGRWFQCAWSEIKGLDVTNVCIQWKEMVAIVVALTLNIKSFRNKVIHIWCDNKPVVDMLIAFRATLSRTDLQGLIHRIARLLIQNNVHLWINHIDGEANNAADALSRFLPEPLKLVPFKLHKKPLACKNLLQHLVTERTQLLQ